jgi:hypothetical protein
MTEVSYLGDIANSSSSNRPSLRTLGQTVRLLLKGLLVRCFGVCLCDMQQDPGAD